MIVKTKTIALTGPWGDEKPRWMVESITNSIEFPPNSSLDAQTIAKLCASTEWEVTITAKPYKSCV